MSGSTPISVPIPRMETVKTTAFPRAAPASCTAPARPTTAVSTRPISACPAWASASGRASFTSARSSSRAGGGMGGGTVKGAVQLAGTALGNAVVFTLCILGIGTLMGVDPLISQALGAGDATRARRLYWQGLRIAVVASLLLLVPTVGIGL